MHENQQTHQATETDPWNNRGIGVIIKTVNNDVYIVHETSEKSENTITQKDTCTPHVHCSIIYNSQDMETT